MEYPRCVDQQEIYITLVSPECRNDSPTSLADRRSRIKSAQKGPPFRRLRFSSRRSSSEITRRRDTRTGSRPGLGSTRITIGNYAVTRQRGKKKGSSSDRGNRIIARLRFHWFESIAVEYRSTFTGRTIHFLLRATSTRMYLSRRTPRPYPT